MSNYSICPNSVCDEPVELNFSNTKTSKVFQNESKIVSYHNLFDGDKSHKTFIINSSDSVFESIWGPQQVSSLDELFGNETTAKSIEQLKSTLIKGIVTLQITN